MGRIGTRVRVLEIISRLCANVSGMNEFVSQTLSHLLLPLHTHMHTGIRLYTQRIFTCTHICTYVYKRNTYSYAHIYTHMHTHKTHIHTHTCSLQGASCALPEEKLPYLSKEPYILTKEPHISSLYSTQSRARLRQGAKIHFFFLVGFKLLTAENRGPLEEYLEQLARSQNVPARALIARATYSMYIICVHIHTYIYTARHTQYVYHMYTYI